MKLALATSLLLCLPAVHAWGVVGHEVVATIANIYLHDEAIEKLQSILPEWTNNRLAPVAAWADRIRYKEHWTGPMHYVSPLNDDPPTACRFDPDNVQSNINVLTAIHNYTHRFATGFDDIDLRFLVHYIGDVHQPLHLISRERGGNGDPVLFENRHFSLHGLWDTQIIAKTLRSQTNYTSPLPSRHVESILRGSIYDPFIRLILWEGIRSWWKNDLAEWLSCPADASQRRSQLVLDGSQDPVYSPCPAHWAAPIHNITCTHVFPPGYDPKELPLREVGGKDYYGRIRDDKIMELLLAKAGIRLAATLNSLLAPTESLLSMKWVEQAEATEQTWQWRYFGRAR